MNRIVLVLITSKRIFWNEISRSAITRNAVARDAVSGLSNLAGMEKKCCEV